MAVESNKNEGKSRILSFFNSVLILFQVITGSVLIITIFKNNFAEISAQIYPEGTPLMGSHLAAILMQKWVAIVIGLILLGILAKEYFIRPLRKRTLINLVLFIVMEGLAGVYVMLMFPAAFG